MKKMKKLLIVIAVLVGFVGTSYATEDGKKVEKTTNSVLDVKPLNGLRFILKLENVEKNTLIEIIGTSGTLYHSEFASKNQSYQKVFDLSNLPDGEIFFKVTAGKDVSIKSFTIETETTRNVTQK
jgi:hypothetical protein